MPDNKKKALKKTKIKQNVKQNVKQTVNVNINSASASKKKKKIKSSSSNNPVAPGRMSNKLAYYRQLNAPPPTIIQNLPNNSELVGAIQSILNKGNQQPIPVQVNSELLEKTMSSVDILNENLKLNKKEKISSPLKIEKISEPIKKEKNILQKPNIEKNVFNNIPHGIVLDDLRSKKSDKKLIFNAASVPIPSAPASSPSFKPKKERTKKLNPSTGRYIYDDTSHAKRIFRDLDKEY